MRSKLALLLALSRGAELLILDEPTSGLDPAVTEEVLQALEMDHSFLLEGGVFTKDLIDTWIDYKRTNEIAPVNLRVTPYEFYLYFDV